MVLWTVYIFLDFLQKSLNGFEFLLDVDLLRHFVVVERAVALKFGFDQGFHCARVGELQDVINAPF